MFAQKRKNAKEKYFDEVHRLKKEKSHVTGKAKGYGHITPIDSTHLPSQYQRSGIGNRQTKESVAEDARSQYVNIWDKDKSGIFTKSKIENIANRDTTTIFGQDADQTKKAFSP
jgi:hypothetical protein